MHFAIHYTTEYLYEAPVTDNLNALRVRPAITATQRVDEFHVRIDPESRLGRHSDYFGTEVIEFGISRPHSALSIDVRARVVTSEPAEPPEPEWDELYAPAYVEAAAEYLLASIPEPSPSALEEFNHLAQASSPLSAALHLCEHIPDRFAYRRGITYVGSTVADLLDIGAGVCQDFVHLGLIVLRRAGIAARYVSGYLFAASADGGDDSVEVDTHAWLEILLPDASGRGEPVWVGLDPTNRTRAGELYVKIGHGRHYDDVPPIKGVYRGGPSHLNARVLMTRLDPATSARA
ncbi:MAG TPA: transglutaminase family protein [Solirubrobacteraceae bacterium]